MQAFEYAHPATVKETLGLLGPGWNDAAILAGGTDLISAMKDDVETPRRVVNIKGVAGLEGIQTTATGTTIGALATIEHLLGDAALMKAFPSLAQAAHGISSPQMRHMGTIAGDLCQRPRCWYFRAGYGLLAMDNGKSLVPGGDNRYHAIFGNEGPAYFVSPSSFAPPLIALGAKVKIEGPKGSREVSLEGFFVAPKSESERENILKPDEVITAITIPAAARGMRNATYEVRQRETLDWPLATASVAFNMGGGTVHTGRVILGHVAPVPWRATAAEKVIAGRNLSEAIASEAADAAVEGARPLSMNKYKVQLARVCVKRALLAALEQGA